MKARSKWVEGFRSVLDNGRGHSIVVDLPPDLGGADTGATALELTVLGLAGCISTIFALVAKKSRVKFDSLEVLVDAEKGTDIPVKKANVKVIVKTSEPYKRIKKVLDHTLANCPVGKIFSKAGTEINVSLEVST